VIGFTATGSGETLTCGYYFGGDNPFYIDRGGIEGFTNPFFTDKFSVTDIFTGNWMIEGVLDRSIFEVFLSGGKFSGTATVFPTSKLNVMWVETTALPPDMVVSVQAWTLESAWAQYENEDGVVVGNTTESGNSTNTKRQMLHAL
jgi:beta-fructofuranosidase